MIAVVAREALRRREYKYLVDERTADRVRRFIEGICQLDRYATTATRSYVCDTLYLDTFGHDIYRATIEDKPVRHKLRIRGYPSAPNAPVFLEVKRRVEDVIVKTRAAVHGDWASFLERGALVERVAARDRDAAENFLAYYEGRYAGPMVPAVLVRYEREPYSSLVDDYARVTFDRKIRFQPKAEMSLQPDDDHWTPVDHPLAMGAVHQSLSVLELKFGTLVPAWLRTMVRELELPRAAFCKYTRAVDALLLRPEARVSALR